jgi:hypothetical protein
LVCNTFIYDHYKTKFFFAGHGFIMGYPPTRTGPAWWVMARSPYVYHIHKEGLCLSSGDINRLMMMMGLFIVVAQVSRDPTHASATSVDVRCAGGGCCVCAARRAPRGAGRRALGCRPR